MKKRLLVVEDHVEFADLMAHYLRQNQCAVDVVYNGAQALEAARNHRYDLVILDVGLPGKDGLHLCQVFREKCPDQMIMMVTARASEADTLSGFAHGADAYLTKPFSFMELNARIRALLRRSESLRFEASLPTQIQQGPLRLDMENHAAWLKDTPLDLTAKEFELLSFLAQYPGHVFSREKLLEEVWGYAYGGYTHTVNSHINRLRRKLERIPGGDDCIVTVRGMGYKFSENLP